MRSAQITLLGAVLLIGTSIPSLAHADDAWSRHPGWLGTWQVTPDIERLLGIEREQGERKHPATLQIGFLLSREIAVRVMGQASVDVVEAKFSKMNHEIVAAGQWEAEAGFNSYPDADSSCFVTKKDGATFLWFGTPTKSLTGAEVHYIRGTDAQHDLLVLDFGMSNWMRKRNPLFSGNAVGYKRKDN